MNNLYAGTPNVALGVKDTEVPVSAVFGSELIRIIEVDSVGKALYSYKPGRTDNSLSVIKKNGAYLVYVNTDIDKEEFLSTKLVIGGALYFFAQALNSEISNPNKGIFTKPVNPQYTATSNAVGPEVQWIKRSSNDAVFSPSNTASTVTIEGLPLGEHQFTLSGKDFQQNTASQDFEVIINDPAGGPGGTRILETTYMTTYFTTFVFNTERRGLIISVPKNIPAGVKLPLVFFNHGAGERGTGWNWGGYNLTPENGIIIGPNAEVYRRGRDFGFIAVSIQILGWGSHEPIVLKEIYDILTGSKVPAEATKANENLGLKAYPIDTDRVHITGLSEGGNGTYMALIAYPQLFASWGVFSGYPAGGTDSMGSIKPPGRMDHNAQDGKIGTDGTNNAYSFIMSGNPPFAPIRNINSTSFNVLEQSHDSWSQVYAGKKGGNGETGVPVQFWDWLTSWRRVKDAQGNITYLKDQTPATAPITNGVVTPISAKIVIGGTREGTLLNAKGFNQDGTNATYLWQVLSGTTVLSDNNLPLVAANGANSGDRIKLTVTNSNGESAQDTITLP